MQRGMYCLGERKRMSPRLFGGQQIHADARMRIAMQASEWEEYDTSVTTQEQQTEPGLCLTACHPAVIPLT